MSRSTFNAASEAEADAANGEGSIGLAEAASVAAFNAPEVAEGLGFIGLAEAESGIKSGTSSWSMGKAVFISSARTASNFSDSLVTLVIQPSYTLLGGVGGVSGRTNAAGGGSPGPEVEAVRVSTMGLRR